MITIDLLTVAKKVNNYEKDATGVTALWPTDKIYKAACPTGKRWTLLGGITYRAVSSTLTVVLKDASDAIIAYLASASAATGYVMYPQTAFFIGTSHVMDAGEYIQADFATSQDANSFASCIILEIDI